MCQWISQIILFITFTSEVFCQNLNVLIETKYGKISGFVKTTRMGSKGNVFLGIPYAQPPIGDLRFEYPKEVKPWAGVYKAMYKRPKCIQWNENTTSEDCLYLNLYAPDQKAKSRPYPVLFWIHGGGYAIGGANNFDVDGVIDNFVSQGLVLVFINYRLEFLGFASTLDNNLPGNYGLEDQLMALKWVNENIDKFGGNPKLVTIAGESAGASSVSLLGISPKSKGYFQRMILNSGSSLAPYALRSQATKNNTLDITSKLRCNNNEQLLGCLRAAKIEDIKSSTSDSYTFLIAAKNQLSDAMLGWTMFTPVKDSYRSNDSMLPDYASKLMKLNAHLPLMVGTTAHEWIEYAKEIIEQISGSNTTWYDAGYHIPLLHYDNAEKVKSAVQKWYNMSKTMNKSDLAAALVKLSTDQMFAYPAVAEIRIYAKRNLPVYAYIFDHTNKVMADALNITGVHDPTSRTAHGHDTVFMFSSVQVVETRVKSRKIDWSDEDRNVTKFLAKSMYNFITTGNPSTEEVKWSKYYEQQINATGGNVLRIHNEGVEVVDYYSNMAKFWDKQNDDNHRADFQ